MSKLKHTLLDNYFLDLPEIKLLRRKFKNDGVLAVIACYLKMSGASQARLEKDEIFIEAETYGVKDVDAWLAFCMLKGLFKDSDGNYSNIHVERDQESYRKKLEYDRNRKGKSKSLDFVFDIDSDPDLKNKIRVLDFLFFNEIELDTWKCKLGDNFDRTCEKLNGWIGESTGTPEFKERIIKGKNAAFTIQNWVAKAVSNEAKNGAAPKQTTAEKIREMGAKLI